MHEQQAHTELLAASAQFEPPVLPDFQVLIDRAGRRRARRRVTTLALAPVLVVGLAIGVMGLRSWATPGERISQFSAGPTATGGPPTAEPNGGPPAPGPAKPAEIRPYGTPEAGTESLPWWNDPIVPDQDHVDVIYSPGCHNQGFVQVDETSERILIRVVRRGPRSLNLCGMVLHERVPLSAPVGARSVEHDQVYQR